MEERYTKSEILFLCAYILWFIPSMIARTRLVDIFGNVQTVFAYTEPLIWILLFLKILEDKDYLRKEIIIFILCMVVTLCASRSSGIIYIVWTIFFAFEMKNVRFYNIAKATLIMQGFIFILTIFLIYGGIIEDKVFGEVVWENTIIVQGKDNQRHDLGFGHPNTASAMLLFLSIVYLYLRKNIKLIEMMIVIILNYLLYMKTGSRTSFLLTILFLPFMWFMDNQKSFSVFWKKVFTGASIGIPFIALFGQIFYNPSNAIYASINQALSGRIRLGHDGFFEFGLKIFGQPIIWRTDTYYNLVDCAYMKILLDLGVVFYILFAVGCFLAMLKLVKAEEKKLCVAFLAWMVFGMIEATILEISFGPFCLLLGQTARLERKEN